MSPRTSEQWAQIRKTTSEKIMKAAVDLFTRHGFHGVSMDQIARRARVSKGLPYLYFDGKEDLFRAVVSNRFDEIEQIMGQVRRFRKAGRRLEQFVRLSVEHVKSNPELYRLYLSVFLQPDAPASVRKLRPETADRLSRMTAFFLDVFGELGFSNPGRELDVFRTMLTGLIYESVSDPAYPVDSVIRSWLSRYRESESA